MGAYDRYQNWELVGKGGMAMVYKVFDAELNINVAIKLLNDEARKNELLREGLKHEVTISYDIPPDKRVCRLYGLYDHNDQFGIIMELIQGNETKDWIKAIRNLKPLKEWWSILKAKLTGHYNYFGISGNYRCLSQFCWQVKSDAYKWINRRSQKKSMNWESFYRYMQSNPLPEPRICYSLYT